MNFNPTMSSLVLEPIYLVLPILADPAADPILDETGNPVRDEKGDEIHGT